MQMLRQRLLYVIQCDKVVTQNINYKANSKPTYTHKAVCH